MSNSINPRINDQNGWFYIFLFEKNIIYLQNTLQMDSLLLSRIKKDVSPAKLTNLSPQKYGKAAWADLTYTPSKLADNVIYRQAATLRKTEEGTSKLRQFQAMNGFMKERLIQLELERDGIERSLNQQITMYKKMLHDSELNHEQRLKEIQKRFNSEISILIQQKEEEAKYSQAEKEMLEGKIAELEAQLKHTEQRESQLGEDYNYLKKQQQKLTEEYNILVDKYKQIEMQKINGEDDARKRLDEAQKKLYQTENIYQERIQNIINEKAKQKDSLQRLMKTQLQKAQNIRMNQNLRKSQQLREIMQSFDSETKRLNEIIGMKDRMVEALTLENAKGKETLLDITKSYESRIHNLSNDKNNLMEQVQKCMAQIANLELQLQNELMTRKTERDQLNNCVVQLKDELQLNQVNYVMERDRFEYWGADVEKQLNRLRTQNLRMEQILADNERLALQLRNLRDLLVESSFQIQKSKEELMRLAFERDNFALQAEKVLQDNEKLYRLKRDSEEEMLKWRNAMYSQRNTYR